MTKKMTIAVTVVVTLMAMAFFKDPATGQANITNLLEWVWPF